MRNTENILPHIIISVYISSHYLLKITQEKSSLILFIIELIGTWRFDLIKQHACQNRANTWFHHKVWRSLGLGYILKYPPEIYRAGILLSVQWYCVHTNIVQINLLNPITNRNYFKTIFSHPTLEIEKNIKVNSLNCNDWMNNLKITPGGSWKKQLQKLESIDLKPSYLELLGAHHCWLSSYSFFSFSTLPSCHFSTMKGVERPLKLLSVAQNSHLKMMVAGQTCKDM